jgi:hypothetical protein
VPLTLSARLLAMPDGNLLHAFKAGEITLAGLFVYCLTRGVEQAFRCKDPEHYSQIVSQQIVSQQIVSQKIVSQKIVLNTSFTLFRMHLDVFTVENVSKP